MVLGAVTAAVAQLVGITMLSTTLSSDHHVQAIFPRIPNRFSPKTEAHVSFVAIRAADYVSSKGWTVTGFTPVDSMLWVPLNHERVTFRAITIQHGAATTRQVPQADQDANDDLGLPRVKKSCCTTGVLRSDFTPPPSGVNPEVAAIIDFPTNHVRQVCYGTSHSRVDTQIDLPAGDFIVIEGDANGQKKELRLHGDAIIYFADLPASYVAGQMPTADSHHYEVYYGMLATTAGCKDWNDCGGARSGHTCMAFNVMRTQKTTNDIVVIKPTPFGDWTRMMDANCSNSQYP